jgi:methionyl aminopeptidase
MHGDLHIPNEVRAGHRTTIRECLLIAIEPWFLQTTSVVVMDPDCWTLRSADGQPDARPTNADNAHYVILYSAVVVGA